VSLEVHRASLNFPKIEQYALADQVRRASKSIPANIGRGFRQAIAVDGGVPPFCANCYRVRG
jgi:four helix bundle protein